MLWGESEMAKFIVTIKRDCWVQYFSNEIEATSREEAARKAEEAWNGKHPEIEFERDSSELIEFDEIAEIDTSEEYGDVELVEE
jgi:hypothetical protein